MASPSDLFLATSNYFSWKSRMEDVLRSKGLYRITLGKETPPIDASKKDKWYNKNDEAHGLIRMSISNDLGFDCQGVDNADNTWTKMETIFNKHNEIRAH
jgi:hypothetical protein